MSLRPRLCPDNQQPLRQQKTVAGIWPMVAQRGPPASQSSRLDLSYVSVPESKGGTPWSLIPEIRPQDLKKWFITLFSPLTNQLPPWPWTPNPWCPVILPYVICNLKAIKEFQLLNISLLFCIMPFTNKIATISPLQFSVFSVWLCYRWVEKLPGLYQRHMVNT